jgi:hypothetical protein
MQDSNPLGVASLILGVAAAALVFAIGLCGLVGLRQGWVRVAGTPLFVCGGSSAFLGLIGAVTGAAGLFGHRPKGAATVGLILSLLGVCLFFAFLASMR